MRVFLPDYGALPVNGMYRPMSTLYQGEKLRLCFYRDGPKFFSTFSQAREAAKEYVAAQINRIRAQTCDEVEPEVDTDPLHFKEWKAERAERIAAERDRVFGQVDTLFIGGGKTVVVEARKRARARA